LKILFVDASRNGWGTEQHLVTLAAALRANGHDVSAVVKRGSPVDRLLCERQIPVHRTAFRGGADPRGILRTLIAIRRERPDWIVTNRAKLYWTLWVIGRMTGVRVAIFRHLPDVRRWVTRCMLPRLVDRFFVVSHYARSRLIRQGAPADRVRVLYNPIDVNDVQRSAGQCAATRSSLGIPADDFVVGYVGRIEEGKGVKVLAEALASIMERSDCVRLLCVGDGPLLADWRGAVTDAGLEGRCHFVPWTSQIGELYSAMDVLVAPSVAPETFCRVVAEAQASRVAVIASRMGGIQEAFAPGHSGLLVAPNDGEALRQAIEHLRLDPALRRAFADAGCDHARARFASRKIAEDFINDLHEPVAAPLLPLAASVHGTPPWRH
jgi:glycosyltransferase involved in cell wall biosynthesis